jgi:hypothetical protein
VVRSPICPGSVATISSAWCPVSWVCRAKCSCAGWFPLGFLGVPRQECWCHRLTQCQTWSHTNILKVCSILNSLAVMEGSSQNDCIRKQSPCCISTGLGRASLMCRSNFWKLLRAALTQDLVVVLSIRAKECHSCVHLCRIPTSEVPCW